MIIQPCPGCAATNQVQLERIAVLEATLNIARQALLYHTAQTRPIDDTSVALATINAVLKGGE